MNLIKFFSIGLFLLKVSMVQSFDTTSYVISKLGNMYLNKNIIKYNINVIQYDSNETKTITKFDGTIISGKSKFYFKNEKYEYYVQDSLMIYVEYITKEILVKKMNSSEYEKISNFGIGSILSYMKDKKIRFEILNSEDNSKEKFAMVFQHLSSDLYTFYIDKLSGFVTNVRVDHYDTNERQEIVNRITHITYTEYEYVNNIDFKKINNYVMHKNGEYVLTNKYKDFNLQIF